MLLVASIGGGGPGILATVLAALAADFWFIPPYGSFTIDAPNDVLAIGIFTGTGLFLSVLAERLRRARWAEALSIAQQERAEQLTRQNDELTRQSEELSQQAEELSQQSEELSGQNEELQAQSEEIQALNEELGHREDLLQSLLEAARQPGSQEAAMQKICAAAQQMFGEAAAAVMVCEKAGRTTNDSRNRGTPAPSILHHHHLPAEHAFCGVGYPAESHRLPQRRVAPPRPVDLADPRPGALPSDALRRCSGPGRPSAR